jgi:hypothetical protein
MPTNVGELTVSITGSVQGLQNALKSAESKLTEFNGFVSRLAMFADLSSKTQTSVQSLQVLELALAGTSTSLQDASEEVSKFRSGIDQEFKAVKKQLAEYKLTVDELGDLSFDDQLLKIAEAFKKNNTELSDQISTLKELGLENKIFFLLVQDGGKKIQETKDELQNYGRALTDIDAHTAAVTSEELATELSKLKILGQGLWDQISILAIPVIKSITKSIRDWGETTDSTGGLITNATRGIVGALGFVGSLVNEVIPKADENVKTYGNSLLNVGIISGSLADRFLKWASSIGVVNDAMSKVTGAVTEQFSGVVDRAKAAQAEAVKAFNERMDQLRIEGAERKRLLDEYYKSQREDEKSLSDEQKKTLENRFSAIQQAASLEFSAQKIAQERRLHQLDDEKFLEIKSKEEIETLKTQIALKYETDRQKMLFDSLTSYYATDAEQAAAQGAKKLLLLQDALKAEVITEQEYADMRVKINQKAALDIMQANARAYTALANIVDTSLGQITALMDSEGKKQFKIFKAISIATALVKGYEAVVSAFAAGNKIGGPPVGFAFAAIAAAGVAAQIAKLVSTDVGSGAGTPTASAGSAAGTDAAAQAGGGGPSQTLFVSGFSGREFFSGSQVRDLAETLLQYQRDGGRVVLETTR